MTLLAPCSVTAHRMFCPAIALPTFKSELDFDGAFSFFVFGRVDDFCLAAVRTGEGRCVVAADIYFFHMIIYN